MSRRMDIHSEEQARHGHYWGLFIEVSLISKLAFDNYDSTRREIENVFPSVMETLQRTRTTMSSV